MPAMPTCLSVIIAVQSRVSLTPSWRTYQATAMPEKIVFMYSEGNRTRASMSPKSLLQLMGSSEDDIALDLPKVEERAFGSQKRSAMARRAALITDHVGRDGMNGMNK
jgi:hypothetical protein